MTMINFSGKTFGKEATEAAKPTDRPKAEFWLNIGYESDVQDSEGNLMFVSLPQGIALDTQEALKTNSRNADFAQFQAARNDLLDQLIAHAQQLKPGESAIINLQVQVRRVNEEAPAASLENNAFVRKLNFA